MSLVNVKCCFCSTIFKARKVDRERGWGKFCSKSCKARKQEKKTKAYKRYINREDRKEVYHVEHGDDDQSWDAHKSYTGTGDL